MRPAAAAALSVLVANLVASGGCYKPHIVSGGLLCAMPGDLCPDDFTCDTSKNPHVCVSSGGGAGGATGGTQAIGGKGGGGAGGMAGAKGSGGKGGIGGSAGAACLAPVSNCTTTFDGGACDPVCNVGCAACDKKCSVNSAGARTCNQLSPKGKTIGLFDFCDPSMVGSDPATQSDNCQPGTACIKPNACSPRCYKFCRTNADCPTGSTCTMDAGGGSLFCTVPVSQCDPVNGVASVTGHSGCASPNNSCYLSEQNATTFCDCYSGPGVGPGLPCTHSTDCFGGLVCAELRSNGKKCARVCRLPSPDGGADLTRRDAGEFGCQSDYRNCVPILLPGGGLSSVFGACNE